MGRAVEVPDDVAPRARAEAPAQLLVLDEAPQRDRERLRVALGNEQPGLAVDHRLGHTEAIGAGDREAAGHPLEDRVRDSVPVTAGEHLAREREDVCPLVLRAYLPLG